jgi:TatA/E family protein of Tat protein translocase
MNILGLGPGELMLIAVLGLIVFGPGRLPEIAAQLGKAVRDLRQSSADIRSEFQRSFTVDLQLDDLKLDEAFKGSSPAALPEAVPAVAGTEAAPLVEPPLADTSAWHWEGGGSSSPPPAPLAADIAYWEWDEARSAGWSAREPLQRTIEWEWDDPPAATNGRENGAAQPSAVDEHALQPSLPAEASPSETEPEQAATIPAPGSSTV